MPPVGIVISSMCWSESKCYIFVACTHFPRFKVSMSEYHDIIILRYKHDLLFITKHINGACSVTGPCAHADGWSSSRTSPSFSQSLLDLRLHDLQPSLRSIRPADTRQWFTGPTGLWLSTAFLYLPVFLSFMGPFAAPPSFISLPVLLCLFSAVLYFITVFPFLPFLCVSSASSYTELLETYLFFRVRQVRE